MANSWLVVSFGLKALWDSISVNIGPSPKEREKDESKNVQTTPTSTDCKPLPCYNPNCKMPWHWKFTQHHRITRPSLMANSVEQALRLHTRLNNVKNSLRFPCFGLNSFLYSVNLWHLSGRSLKMLKCIITVHLLGRRHRQRGGIEVWSKSIMDRNGVGCI